MDTGRPHRNQPLRYLGRGRRRRVSPTSVEATQGVATEKPFDRRFRTPEALLVVFVRGPPRARDYIWRRDCYVRVVQLFGASLSDLPPFSNHSLSLCSSCARKRSLPYKSPLDL